MGFLYKKYLTYKKRMSPFKCYTTGRMMDVFPKDVSGSSPKFGKYRINWQTIERVNDVLYLTLRECQLITNYRVLLLVPRSIRKNVFNIFHSDRHYAVSKTTSKIMEKLY